MSEPTSINELVAELNYYECLVEDWENWADKVERMIDRQ